ncbi:hypothetical protein ACOTET_23105 [Achromobacter xylosoxidans]
MDQLRAIVESVKLAVANSNWYAALALALTMPDICGKIDNPNLGSQARYAAWFDTYIGPKYRRPVLGQEHIFMAGTDCYALRCSFLHEGGEHAEGRAQAVRAALDRFHFVAPKDGNCVHMNQFGSVLQLQVDTFCMQLAGAMDYWLQRPETTQALATNPPQILTIYSLDQSVWDPSQKIVLPA